MDQLKVGVTIDIRRSDGRTHAATISALHRDNGMVDVEWFEADQAKGKSMEIAAVLRWNPTLAKPNSKVSETPGPPRRALSQRQPMPPPPAPATMSRPLSRKSILPPRTNVTQDKASKGQQHRRRTVYQAHVSEVKTEAVSSTERVTNEKSANGAKSRVAVKKEDEKQAAVKTEDKNRVAVKKEDERQAALKTEDKHRLVVRTEEIERGRLERRAKQEEERRLREQFDSLQAGSSSWEFHKMIRDFRADLDFQPLSFDDPIIDDRICVCVRKRPMSVKEKLQKEIDIVTIPDKEQLVIHQPKSHVDMTKYLDNQKFRFDYVFDDTANNEMVYRFTAQPLVKTIFEGGFATCFAYGQTGSGKTHTMGGDFEGKTQDCSKGIYAQCASDVFNYLEKPEYSDLGLYVVCSFFELYGSKPFDLLEKRAERKILEDRKKNVQIVGLKETEVINADEVLALIHEGSMLRTAGQTSANTNSSRSHAIFQIILKRSDNSAIHGKFSLIDLAGSERGADTKASDALVRREGGEINNSLLSLKECIRAMAKMKTHVPFRQSKLTLVLRDSFIGKNARTCMIATISPGLLSAENTLNTLRYADRVKELDLENGDDDANATYVQPYDGNMSRVPSY